ncbi:addiction module toxin RelE [Cloacibacterium sp.]|uniref:addiction module toxin RelE n=1 Tax=Cloacibacterium sp. TaxID=1913682 RepID=UPI0039E67C29
METQFNFQMKQRNDKKEWEDIEVYYQTHCDRTTAIRYARKLSKIFNLVIRMTQGGNPFKTSGTYIYENAEPLKIKNYGKLVQ